MEHYNMGPNGAQVVCADLLALKAGEIRSILDGYDVDYILIDTPGQMELFTMRESSRAVIDVLGAESSLLTFLFDPVVSSRPGGFVSLLLLFASAWFRFYYPSVSVLSKVDLMEAGDLERVLEWSTNPDVLFDSLSSEKATMDNQMAFQLLKTLESLEIYRPLIPISAETFEGMDDLYNVAQQTFFGGEDLMPD
jgi:GTPase Era involved in 16S rRNA processing